MSANSELLTQLTIAISKLTDNAVSTSGIQVVAVKLKSFGKMTQRSGFFERKHNFELNL